MPNGAASQAPPIPASLRSKPPSELRNAVNSWHCSATAVANRFTSTFCPSPVRSRWKSATMAEYASSSAVLASTTEEPHGWAGLPGALRKRPARSSPGSAGPGRADTDVGAVRPEPCPRDVHDRGVDLAEVLISHAQPVQHPGPEVLGDEIAAGGELADDVPGAGAFEVQRQALLVPVHGQEERALPAEQLAGGGQPTLPLPHPGPFHLDDFGAHVGQELRGPRAHHHLGEVQDPDPSSAIRVTPPPLSGRNRDARAAQHAAWHAVRALRRGREPEPPFPEPQPGVVVLPGPGNLGAQSCEQVRPVPRRSGRAQRRALE